jgi:hypothetical protein
MEALIMTPPQTVTEISKIEIKEKLAHIAKRYFDIGVDQLLEKAKTGQLDPCEDAEILTLIHMLGSNEQRCLSSNR